MWLRWRDVQAANAAAPPAGTGWTSANRALPLAWWASAPARRPVGNELRRSNASATHDSMVDEQHHDRADDRHKHAVDIEPTDTFSPELGK